MSLDRADSISPDNCVEQYKKANAMLRTCPATTPENSDSDDESVQASKLVVDLNKMPAGQYEYYTNTSGIMNQMLLYMYHTIHGLVHIPDGDDCAGAEVRPIPLKLRRRPYKYDKEDFCYSQIGYGNYKYTYTVPATKTEPEKSAEFFITYRQQDKIVGSDDEAKKFEYMTILTDSPVVFHHFYRESDNFLENNEQDVSKLHVYVMTKYGEWMRYNKIPSRTLDTVYFDEKLKQKMRADIIDFLKKEKDYEEFGIPYKKNYLLTGIPGSGKTSIIKAMCKEIGYNLCIF